MRVPVAVRLVANWYTAFTLQNFTLQWRYNYTHTGWCRKTWNIYTLHKYSAHLWFYPFDCRYTLDKVKPTTDKELMLYLPLCASANNKHFMTPFLMHLVNMFSSDNKLLIFAPWVDKKWDAQKSGVKFLKELETKFSVNLKKNLWRIYSNDTRI